CSSVTTLRYPALRKAVVTSTSNDIELPAAPAKMYGPHMVEYQRKFRPINQSKAANDSDNAKMGRPANAILRIQTVQRGLPSRSWATEKRRSKKATPPRRMK